MERKNPFHVSRNTQYASRMMCMEYLYHVITGHRTGVLPTLIRALLTPLSWIYGLFVAGRGGLYERRILAQRHLPCAVMSVGNIVAGGTGKTPTVIWMANYLRDAGFRVAILLRGYRRKRNSAIAVVSDGTEILLPPAESGDEAGMIAKAAPGVPVLVGQDRYASGLEAVRRWNVQAVILDDGFQHRRLARDLDIVTVDGARPFGTGRTLPAGTLREPRRALRRADAILLTRMDALKTPAHIRTEMERFAPTERIWESCHRPTRLYRLGTEEAVAFSLLRGKCVLAVCGIGVPESFAETLRRYAPARVELLAFPDHHPYGASDLLTIRERARQTGADLVVMTQKDEQKISSLHHASAGLPLFVLAVELVLTTRQGAFEKLLHQALDKTYDSAPA